MRDTDAEETPSSYDDLTLRCRWDDVDALFVFAPGVISSVMSIISLVAQSQLR